MNLDGSGLEAFLLPQGGTTDFKGIAVDPAGEQFYWLENKGPFGSPTAKLYRSDLQGGNIQVLRDLGDTNS